MKKNFYDCLGKVGVSEGGYSDDRHDSGNWHNGQLIGTNHGISAPVLAQWMGRTPTKDEMKKLKKATADSIYKAKYWDSLRCDDLPSGVDYTVFDFGINSGIDRSAKFLQRVVGTRADGIVGGMTLHAVSHHDPSGIIREVNTKRLSFLEGLRMWWRYGRGWKSRVERVNKDSLLMAREEK